MIKTAFHLSIIILSVLFLASCGSSKLISTNHINNKNGSKSKTLRIKVKEVVSTAREQLGTPHTYKNPSGGPSVDCSGMTCKSYAAVGIKLPRRSSDQATVGKFVFKKNLQAGDLVFFSSKKGRKGISHVGLISRVENGKTYFIHTSTSRGVVEDDFYMQHWQDTFVTARRVL